MFALAELGAGIVIGEYAARERAEVALFAAFRPLLLLLLVLAARQQRLPARAGLYVAALVAAAAAEALLAWRLGGTQWIAAARLAGAGLALALLFDAGVGIGRRLGGRALGAVTGLALLLLPGGPVTWFERAGLASASPATGARPIVSLLTGLPLRWGEDGIAGALTGADETPIHRMLAREFMLVPIDDPAAARGVLLLAQPRPPGPGGLVAIDSFVRGGGRALILTDRRLAWESRLPPGDPRRRPDHDGLAPLLAHWGVDLRPGAARLLQFDDGGGVRRLALDGADKVAGRADCRPLASRHAALCAIGRGRVIVVGDADLLDGRLWVPLGNTRESRTADNALLVAEWLDLLAGSARDRADAGVAWRQVADPWPAIVQTLALTGLLPIAGAVLRRRRALT